MRRYRVKVERIGEACRDIEVEADTRYDAEEFAIKKAKSMEFKEHDASYSIRGTALIFPTKTYVEDAGELVDRLAVALADMIRMQADKDVAEHDAECKGTPGCLLCYARKTLESAEAWRKSTINKNDKT